MNKKYNIIYADPPWNYKDGFSNPSSNNCNISMHYPTMDLQDIKNLSIEKIAKEDCLLFIWTTDAHLPKCLEVIKAWGFKYITVGFYWYKKTKNNKTHIVFGRWTLKSVEMCLLAGRGHPSYLKFVAMSVNL
jgi:N6-adenosine-specific RNA methylase IME4